MATNRSGSGALTTLQIVVAVYLATLGITGITLYSSGGGKLAREFARLFGGGGSLDLVVAIIELVAGALVFLALFPFTGDRARFAACFISAVLWLVWVLYSLVLHNALEPSVIAWLNRLALDLVVGVALWLVSAQYRCPRKELENTNTHLS